MIKSHTFTEPGGHETDEDALLCARHPLDPGAWLVFVADGQGGQHGGAEASKLACRAAASFRTTSRLSRSN